MTLRHLLLACMLIAGSMVQASPAQGKLKVFLQHYASALEQQHADAIDAMIDNQARIRVTLKTSDEPLILTLSKAEYLQQLRALWRFASDIHYQISDVTIQPGNAAGTTVMLKQTEVRTLFGEQTGETHRIKLSVVDRGGELRIAEINSRTHQW